MTPSELLSNSHDIELLRGSGVVTPRPVTFVEGRGVRLFDDAGRSYLDLTAGHGAASLGHGHPALAAALAQQASRLTTCTVSFANDVRATYLEELHAVLPAGLERLFLCNSGTEAVEAALKFARLASGRSEVVACVKGFHGRTLGALSATHEKRYREPFAPLVPGFRHVPYNRPDAMAEAVTESTAAVILEVIQGEGGVRPADAEFLHAVRQACDRSGALLIVDEVQTGFGRTGSLFAVEHTGLQPDLLCMAKGIAGGVPMGAVAIGASLGAMPGSSHGSTFGGNPLACAAARAVLGELNEGLLEHAASMGARLESGLRGLESDRVRSVRGRGLMLGVELRERVAPHLGALLDRGVVALSAGPQVLRLLPPLVITPSEVDEAIGAIQEVLA